MATIRSHAFAILLGAAIFAVIGFYMMRDWGHRYLSEPGSDGELQIIPMVELLRWTLQGGAIVFAVAGILTLIGLKLGALLYGAAGAFATLAMLAVAGWEMTTPLNSGVGPLILIVLGAYTGYTSVTAIHDGLKTPPRREDGKARA